MSKQITHSVWHHKRISSDGDIGGAEGLSISSGESGSSSSAGAEGIGDDASSESNSLQKVYNDIKNIYDVHLKRWRYF